LALQLHQRRRLVGESVCAGMKVADKTCSGQTGAQTPSYAAGDGTNSLQPATVTPISGQSRASCSISVTSLCVDVVNERSILPADCWCTAVLPVLDPVHRCCVQCRQTVRSGGHQAVHQRLQHHRPKRLALPGASCMNSSEEAFGECIWSRNAQRDQLPNPQRWPTQSKRGTNFPVRSAGHRAGYERLQRRRHASTTAITCATVLAEQGLALCQYFNVFREFKTTSAGHHMGHGG